MATDEHIIYANTIKKCHRKLRDLYKEFGAEEAWKKHKADKDQLMLYGKAMQELAKIWDKNSEDPNSSAFSRIKWASKYCLDYYYNSICLKKRAREMSILRYWYPSITTTECQILSLLPPDPINVLDVGSCYNPFAEVPGFHVTALDLYPTNDAVLAADFLKVNIENIPQLVELKNEKVAKLKSEYFHCVIFSLLLEYMPSSAQRIQCIRKAFSALCPEGILIIITPDSAHLGKNVQLWKQWRQTLASEGFIRICFEKLAYITCMVFRKPINPLVPKQWLDSQSDHYAKELHIPQDDE